MAAEPLERGDSGDRDGRCHLVAHTRRLRNYAFRLDDDVFGEGPDGASEHGVADPGIGHLRAHGDDVAGEVVAKPGLLRPAESAREAGQQG